LNLYLSILANSSGSMFMLIPVFPFAAMTEAYTVYSVLTTKHRRSMLTMRKAKGVNQICPPQNETARLRTLRPR
jgi:hypothetical protein